MNSLVYIVYLMVFVTCFMLFYMLMFKLFKNSYIISSRLGNVSKQDDDFENINLNQSIFIRIIRPIFDDFSKSILKVTPNEIIKVFEKKVLLAGNPFKLSVRDWLNIVVVLVAGLPLFTFVIGITFDMVMKNIMLLVLIEVILGVLIPNFILNIEAKKRKKILTNSLPDVIDLLTVTIEAGLGFDSALAKVVEKVPGPLAAEFAQVINEIKVGKSKRDALKDMSSKLDVKDITTFISSIVQAEQLGVSIGKVLRIQSEQMRQKRRQRAQEKAMKATIKMLIPMILFIFPTIFGVVLGPTVINLLESLK